ncbi:hypothetical protein HYH03_010727 [Edaphochlamys debaryana]|uniref:Uncharacterized protein n=1 Tax=Edaphochlamys debaryana TaxID=47281 RepID=A0A835Y1H3_9CHLO|nr:hypothetical protein HYH03_010727 [Edaphochlamys debaryana]|eukprot:KAG2490805.1 hypothetical protein HYH03_010727 [Edaphochlamys debaryana]
MERDLWRAYMARSDELVLVYDQSGATQPRDAELARRPWAVDNAASATFAAYEGAGAFLTMCVQPLSCLSRTDDWPLVHKYGGLLFEPRYLTAVSQAALSVADLVRYLDLGDTQARLDGRGMQSPELLFTEGARIGAFFAFAIAQYLHFLAFTVEGHVEQTQQERLMQGLGAAAGGRPPADYKQPVPQLATGLRNSKLVGGAASLILACLGPDYIVVPGQTAAPADAAESAHVAQMHEPGHFRTCRKAVRYFAHTLVVLGRANTDPNILGGGRRPGPEVQRVHDDFAEALVHPEAARLRLAMLATVWAQAGLEQAAGSGAGRRSVGTGGEGSGGASGRGSAASGSGGCTHDTPHLYVHHNHVIAAALGTWQGVRLGLVSMSDGGRLPPLPGVPPALQAAQLAVRTGEALGRLMRGQGLCGMYGPRQRAFTAQKLIFIYNINPTGEDMPDEGWDPRALPLWTECLAWMVGVTAEVLSVAQAGANEDLKAAGPVGGKNVPMLAGVLGGCVETLCRAAERLHQDWQRAGKGIPQPGVPSRDAVLSRLRVAGLGAGLDHALRLACADLDQPTRSLNRSATFGFDLEGEVGGNALDRLPPAVCRVLTNLRLDPLAPVEGQPLGEAGGALLTYAKRARVVARRLEAAAPGAGGQPDPRLYLPSGSRQPPGSLTAALANCAALLRRRQEGAQGPDRSVLAVLSDLRSELAPAPAPISTLFSAATGSAAAELEAFLYQCTGALAARVGCDVSSLARPGDLLAGLALEDSRTAAGLALGECLHYVTRLGEACGAGQGGTGAGAEQAEGRLLACQPHRLIAAACKQLCAARSPSGAAAPDGSAEQWRAALTVTLARLAANPLLSSRVRRWLVPAAGGSGGGSGAQAGTEAAAEQGCLERSWREGPWGVGGLAQSPPFDARELLREYGNTSAPAAQRAAAAVLDEALPPALEAPPQGRVWAQLRVCCFPGCVS